MTDADAIILGGGAAGLMCAAVAGARGRRVLVLERAERVGKKILISGGGRCNFTNLHAGPENFLCGQPEFPRSALARYRPEDFIALVERHGIAYHEKKLGQLFCDGSSRQIVEMLLAECADCGGRVSIATGCAVNADGIQREPDGAFSVTFNGVTHRAPALVVAAGGLSFPKLGGSSVAHRIAQRFGLRLVEPRPGLVPLIFNGDTLEMCAELSGVALPCAVRTDTRRGKRVFHESLLFTHRGMSGPAILQISSYLPADGATFTINFAPGGDAEAWLASQDRSGAQAQNLLAAGLPARLADRLCRAHGFYGVPAQRLPKTFLSAVARQLDSWIFEPTGTEGYAKAEVTLGGVDTRDLDSRTMAAREVPGLYFIGEAVDVTGQLGGFNFQWAWASGSAAGETV